jgi:hypothetical protein
MAITLVNGIAPYIVQIYSTVYAYVDNVCRQPPPEDDTYRDFCKHIEDFFNILNGAVPSLDWIWQALCGEDAVQTYTGISDRLWDYQTCYVLGTGPLDYLINVSVDQFLGRIVAAREVVYMATIFAAVLACPVFLMLDPVAVWEEAERGQRGLWLASYILTPHRYVARCLANRFQDRRAKLFLTLAKIQVIADVVSCLALARLLSRGDRVAMPAAMLAGYAMTATGLIFFFGPVAVMSNLAAAFDGSKGCLQRFWRCLVGSLQGIGLVYTIIWYGLLLAGHDTSCPMWGFPNGYTFNAPGCSGRGTCAPGGLGCGCDLGYGPPIFTESSNDVMSEINYIQAGGKLGTRSQQSCKEFVQPCATVKSPCCGKHCETGSEYKYNCSSSRLMPSPCICEDSMVGKQCAPAYNVSGFAEFSETENVFGVYARGDQIFAGKRVYISLSFQPDTATTPIKKETNSREYTAKHMFMLHRSNRTRCRDQYTFGGSLLTHIFCISTDWAIDSIYLQPNQTLTQAVASFEERTDSYALPMLNSGPASLCPLRPDELGCVGTWQEGTKGDNPSVRVVALGHE